MRRCTPAVTPPGTTQQSISMPLHQWSPFSMNSRTKPALSAASIIDIASRGDTSNTLLRISDGHQLLLSQSLAAADRRHAHGAAAFRDLHVHGPPDHHPTALCQGKISRGPCTAQLITGPEWPRSAPHLSKAGAKQLGREAAILDQMSAQSRTTSAYTIAQNNVGTLQ